VIYPARNGSTMAEILKIRKQPPTGVLINEVFEIGFLISGNDDRGVGFQVSVLRNSLAVALVEQQPKIVQPGVPMTLRCSIIGNDVSAIDFSEASPIELTVTRVGQLPLTVLTNPVRLVLYKILVTTGPEWTDVWYKDEGGRDKCMEVISAVVDHNCESNLGAVTLQLTLCYSNWVPCNQDILRVLGPSKLELDSNTGKAKIRFRIEDVSKNHQGQDFSLRISALSDNQMVVGDGFTPPVTVRSKRNKRERHTLESRNSKRRGSASMQASLFDTEELIKLEEAVRDVSLFVEEAVQNLYPLQWQIVGYAHDSKGNPDYSRPFHNMTNPNALIARMLHTYNSRTQRQLKLLQTAFDQDISKKAQLDWRASASHPLLAQSQDPSLHGPVPFRYPSLPGRASSSQPPIGSAPALFSQQKKQQAALTKTKVENSLIRSDDNERTIAASVGQAKDDEDFEQHDDNLDLESQVEYLLAKQFKSMRTGERLGFPAYSSSKKLLGFYRRHSTGEFQFEVALDFGSKDMEQANQIFDNAGDAIQSKSDWKSIQSMLNHALVYEWRKGISGAET
jgi:hypothetical protein